MSASNGTLNGFHYSEARIAEACGLSRDDARLIRSKRLQEGVHWVKKDREIALSHAGVKKLWRCIDAAKPHSLDLSACTLPSVAKKGAASPTLALPERVTFARPAQLRVCRIPGNARILHAKDNTGQIHHVIVGNSDNFVVGMELPAAPSLAHPGFYQLVGKPPRERGRWR